jgi:fimbrial isopeptide formation D2 family protein
MALNVGQLNNGRRGGRIIMKRERNGARVRRRIGLLTVSLSALMIIGMSFLMTQESDAVTYTFNKPNTSASKPVAFQNGSFEQPDLKSNTPYALGGPNSTWGSYYYDNDVPGWSTINVNPADKNNPYRNCLQIIPSGTYVETPIWGGYHSIPVDGKQYTELNADCAQRLYQDVATVPGSRLYWSFCHESIGGQKNGGADSMDFSLRPSGSPATQPSASEIQATVTTYSKNSTGGVHGATSNSNVTISDPVGDGRWIRYSGLYTVPSGQTSTQFAYEAVSTSANSIKGGNFLDDLHLQTGASLIAEKSIYNAQGNRIDGAYDEYSDIATIKIKVTNWGETDSSRTVLTDTLWTGLEYVSGSGYVTIDGLTAGTVNCSGDTINANIGRDATSTAGGTLAGSVATGNNLLSPSAPDYGKGKTAVVTFRAKITGNPGLTVKNQAKVTYNDKGYESYNAGGVIAYSTVDYGIANPDGLTTTDGNFTLNILNPDGSVRKSFKHTNTSDEDSYVNLFTIVDRQVSGTAWVDTDKDGDYTGDSSEIRLANMTVWMQKLNGGTWTAAYDCSGTTLSTTTDSNGKYTFRGVTTGTYRVVMDSIGYVATYGGQGIISSETQSTTGIQGNPENDCVDATVNSAAAVLTPSFIFSASSYTPSSPIYYIYNADFGVIKPTGDVTISKVVTGNDFADPNDEFTFTVSVTGLTSSTNVITYAGIGTYASGGTMTLALNGSTGTKSFTMKSGDSITLKNLPRSSKVTVTETANPDYTASYTYKVGNGTESERVIGSTCTIDSLTGRATTVISFTNTRNEVVITALDIPGGWSTGTLLVLIMFLAADLLYLISHKSKCRQKN